MLIELENSEWLGKNYLDTLGKLFAVSFQDELNEIDTFLTIYCPDNNMMEEHLYFSLKVGETWLTAKLPSILFAKNNDIENSFDLIRTKVVPQIKHNPIYGEFIKLNKLKGDFQ